MAFLIPDNSYILNGVLVKEYFLTKHNPNKIAMPTKRTKSLIGITIHNTEDIKPATGTTKSEQYTRATVNGNMGDVRVHYYVDEIEAWKNLPDDWCGWHAADGSGNGNTATIAIEVIGKSAEAEANAIKLVAALMDKYDLDIDNLFTHSYWMNVRDGATGAREYLNTLHHPKKNCPAYILPHWNSFEAEVKKALDKLQEVKEVKPPVIQKEEDKKLYSVKLTAFFDNQSEALQFFTQLQEKGYTEAKLIEEKYYKPPSKTIQKGSLVKVKKNAKTYDGSKTLAAFVYQREYTVKEINNDRAVIAEEEYTIAAVNVKDLILIS